METAYCDHRSMKNPQRENCGFVMNDLLNFKLFKK